MEQKHVREIRAEILRLEADAKAAQGSSVLLPPEERERFEKVVARIDVLRKLLTEGAIEDAGP